MPGLVEPAAHGDIANRRTVSNCTRLAPYFVTNDSMAKLTPSYGAGD